MNGVRTPTLARKQRVLTFVVRINRIHKKQNVQKHAQGCNTHRLLEREGRKVRWGFNSRCIFFFFFTRSEENWRKYLHLFMFRVGPRGILRITSSSFVYVWNVSEIYFLKKTLCLVKIHFTPKLDFRWFSLLLDMIHITSLFCIVPGILQDCIVQ